ncbi:MAG: glycosyltransferase [Candidatus Eisenbacteria bacterium]|nr:glycosyltransferase [Candidatus Eisenbacteria bacterium]
MDHVGGVHTFREKYRFLASDPGIDLTVFVPEKWIENGRLVRARSKDEGYAIRTGKAGFRGYENRGFFYTGLARALSEVRPHIFHLNEEPYSVIALQCVLLARIFCPRAPILFYTFDNLHPGFHYPYRPSWFYGLVQRYVHRRASVGMVGCSDALTILRSRGFTKPVRFVPLAVDPESYRTMDVHDLRNDLDLRDFVIGFVGRLIPMKGISVLLDALGSLPFPWSLFILGDGEERTRIEEYARDSGNADRVRIVPMVSHADVPRFLNLLDTLVLPSRTTNCSKEQFGRVLIEAMACGVPVVGSDSGSIPEVIGEGGRVVPEGDPTELAAVLCELRDNAEERKNLGRAGRERVLKHFTWQRVAEIYKSIYRDLLEGTVPSEEDPPWSTCSSHSRRS